MIAGASAPAILVTGAGGFIGGATAAALAAAGFPVRAGARNLKDRTAAGANPAPTACDLDNPQDLRAAAAGAGAIVHCAYGDVAAMADQCGRLLSAMTEAKACNLILLSSIAVYGDREGIVDEAAEPLGELDAYARAKIACEALTRAWAGDRSAGKRRVLALRPGIVYGQGSRFWVDKLAARILAGAWGDFGPLGEGRAALIHIDDLTSEIVAAVRLMASDASATWAPWMAVNAIGPETPTWNAYFHALAARLDASPLAKVDAAAIARRQILAAPAKAWRRLGLPGGGAAALAPTRGEILLFSRSATYATDRARALLGATPAITLDDGLSRIAWPRILGDDRQANA